MAGEVEVRAGGLDAATVAEVRSVVAEVVEVDGVAPLSEHVALHLRHGGDHDTYHLLIRADDGALAGYAHLDLTEHADGASAELAVAPRYRGQGLGRRLGRALLEAAERGQCADQFQLWAHGANSAAHSLAQSLGLRRVRELRQLRRSLLSAMPAPQLPTGVAIRTFQPGVDDDAWLALNARAFADHPEQGDWTTEDLRRRLAARWFDPAGFFLAERADRAIESDRRPSDPGGRSEPVLEPGPIPSEPVGQPGPAPVGQPGPAPEPRTDPRLVGFHWTKIHGGGSGDPAVGGHGHEPVGEVYVLGVDPDEQGSGLGRALTLVGLRHLRAQGLSQAMLYVEGDNAPALRLYASVGFVLWDTDTVYGTPPRRAGAGR